jgi:hypothetical protein
MPENGNSEQDQERRWGYVKAALEHGEKQFDRIDTRFDRETDQRTTKDAEIERLVHRTREELIHHAARAGLVSGGVVSVAVAIIAYFLTRG